MSSLSSPAQDSETRIVLIGRPGCHLCDDARRVVVDVAERTSATWRELSVDDDAQLRQKYGELIPVVLVDGRMHAQFHVDGAHLQAALQGRHRWWRRG